MIKSFEIKEGCLYKHCLIKNNTYLVQEVQLVNDGSYNFVLYFIEKNRKTLWGPWKREQTFPWELIE